jgi:hypothetical protein
MGGGIFIFGAYLHMLAQCIYKNLKHDNGLISTYQKSLPVLTIGTISLAVALPWFIWSLNTTDRLTPMSGAALRHMRLESSSYISLVQSSIYQTFAFAWNTLFYSLSYSFTLSVMFTLFSLFVLLVLYLKGTIQTLLKKADFVLTGITLYYVAYWLYVLGMCPWYSPISSMLFIIILSIFIHEVSTHVPFFSSLRESRKVLAVSFLLFLSFITNGIIKYQSGKWPQERTKKRVAKFIDRDISAELTVGSFNTGIIHFHTSNHDIINLDGVVNPISLKYGKAGCIECFLRKKEIEIIADPPSYVENLSCNLNTIKKITNQNFDDIVYKVYRIKDCDCPRGCSVR